jgi:hypothetical protein
MKKIIVFVIMILILIVGLSGCNESNKSSNTDEVRIIGSWFISELIDGKTNTITYIFLPDKTYKVIGSYDGLTENFSGIWKIEDNKLIVTIEGRTLTGDYQFSNNDKTLTITDTFTYEETVLTKQE